MNRRVATVVVIILVFAMVSTIAWNEYLARSKGVWERGGAGVLEQDTSVPELFLPTNTTTTLPTTPAPTPPSLVLSDVEGSPTPMPPSLVLSNVEGSPTPLLPSTPTPTVAAPPLMQVASQFGVNLRDAPAGEVIRGLADGTLVQAYPEGESEADGLHWLHVVTLDGVEGWLAVNNLIPFSGTLAATP